MLLKKRIHQAATSLVVATLSLTLVSVIAPPAALAATTVYINDTDAPLAFVKTNSVNIVGSGGTAVNNVVLYKAVGTYGGVTIDAVVTTLAVSGSITNYDNPGSASTAAGYLNNFMINTTGGEARFRFEFFRSGTYTGANTGIPVVLQNVKITSIDLDCSSSAGSYQYTDATGFQKYSMMSPTNLAVQSLASPARVRFIANKTGSRSSVPEDQVMLKYDAIQTVEFSFGNVVAGSTNWFGLVFGGWPNGGAPVEYTNIFNAPPTSTDTTLFATSGDSTTVSVANFGTYADTDNNPFMAVKIGTVSGGTLQWNNGSTWSNVTTNQAITIADIEAGKLRFNATGAGSIQFWVYDGLDYSTNSNVMTVSAATAVQVITFTNPGTKGLTGGSFDSGATSSSGLTVELVSLTPGICSISGLSITPVAAGTCVIVAKQPGSANFGAAKEVTQEFIIVAGAAPTLTQTITFNQPADQSLDTATVASGASSLVSDSTRLTPTLTSNTPTTCGTTGETITILAVGTCTVTASQAGTSTVAPATNIVRSFNITSVAGGGTVPIAQTWGAAIPTGGSNLKLTGFVDWNSASTTYYFCWTETSPSADAKILTQSGTLPCSATQTSTTVGQVLSADISFNKDNSTSGSNIKRGKNVYFQIVAYHSSGNKVYGNIMMIPSSQEGYISTTAATNELQKSATVNGTAKSRSDSLRSLFFCVNAKFNIVSKVQLANTDGKCDYKLTSNPATLTNKGSTSSANASATGLLPNTYYYYQLYISSTSKSTYGNVMRFKTSAANPLATTLGTSGYNSSGVTLIGSIQTNDNTVYGRFCVTNGDTSTAGVLNESDCIGGLRLASPDTITAGTAGINVAISGLSAGSTYYYQAIGLYGVNSKTYGSIRSFTFGAPAATTLAAGGVKVTSGVTWEAQLNGYIKPNGSTATNYFCLAETNTVSSKGAMTECVPGGGLIAIETATAETLNISAPVSLNKSGLTAGTTYYFQAISRNLGVSPSLDSFGEVMSFITANAPTVTTEEVLLFGIDTATVRGTMNANGALATGSFCVSSSNATTAIDGVLDSCLFTLPTSPTTTSTSTDTTGDATGLSQATTYYYQAIADNSQGTTYGSIRQFTTLAGAPNATTVAASAVSTNAATLNGRLNPGGAATTARFCYGTSSTLSGCTLSDTVTVIAGTAGLTSVSLNLSGLASTTTYYFQVRGINSQGQTDGLILQFTTGAPSVVTQAATAVGTTVATLNGTAKANGADVTNVKFCLADSSTVTNGQLLCNQSSPLGGRNATPTTFAATITDSNPESFTVTGLTSGTLYYFQIQATNSRGTAYGEVLTFTTGAPVGLTKPATSISSSNARLNATVNRNGDSTASAVLCISSSDEATQDGALANCDEYAIPSSQLVNLNTDDPVFTDVTGLVAGNIYFFQVQVSGTANGDLTNYGEILNFSTGYTVQFLANGGSGSMNNQSSTNSASLTNNGFSKASATFAGWSLTSGGSVAFANGAIYDFSANLTLYAIWNAVSAPAPVVEPTITKQKLKLSWGNPSPINFGTPLGGGQLNAGTDQPAVCVYTPAPGTILAPGTYTLSVTCTPVNGSLYEAVSGTVTLEVKKVKGKPRIIWFNPSPITNPTPLTGTQLNAVASVPGTYEYSPAAGTVLSPGRHKLNVKFSPTNKDDNDDIDANVTIDVLAPKVPSATPTKPSDTSTVTVAPVVPTKPVSAPDTKTATTPALKPMLQTAGVTEVVTVKPNEDKTGIIVSSENWSLQIKSTTQFVQGNTQDTSARVVIEKGNTVTTSGTGFKPFSQVDVYVYSTPTWLGAVMTDEFGNFTTTLPMPNALPEGDHTFQAQGQTPESKERVAAIPITLVPATIVNKPGSMRFEVYFAMNSVVISKAEKAKTANMIKLAKSKIASGAKVTVEISGWVQPNPNPGNVKYLSTGRAKNVRDLVQALGLKGSYTLKYPGLDKDNIPSARHASVIIKWSKSK